MSRAAVGRPGGTEALREYLEALSSQMEALRNDVGGLKAGQERLEGRIDVLRVKMHDMEARLINSIEHRRVDEDIAFRHRLQRDRRVQEKDAALGAAD